VGEHEGLRCPVVTDRCVCVCAGVLQVRKSYISFMKYYTFTGRWSTGKYITSVVLSFSICRMFYTEVSGLVIFRLECFGFVSWVQHCESQRFLQYFVILWYFVMMKCSFVCIFAFYFGLEMSEQWLSLTHWISNWISPSTHLINNVVVW
jgi:hypothetical protein